MSQRVLIVVLFVCAAAAASVADAQEATFVTDAVLINPGARSIALGGAFAAIADDATAALANPAGLVQIVRPEISGEVRGTVSTNDFDNPLVDDTGVTGLGFVSFVYPGRNWAVAVYSHQLASLDILSGEFDPFARELTVQSYSAAAGFQISDRLSIGAGASYYDADVGGSTNIPGTSDTGRGLNAGIMWNAADFWRLAGFYRQGPDFETDPGARLSFPDVWGAAVAFQPGGRGWTFGFEVDNVGETVEPQPSSTIITEGGTELHFGVEYAVLKWKPVVAFRTGVWREPGGDLQTVEEAQVTSMNSRDSLNHFSFGFGFAFRKFQLDLGWDISERTAIGSLSMVISF